MPSIKPSEAVSGGLLDNVDVTIKAAVFENWDYNGTAPSVPAIKLTMELDDGSEHEQYYSVGKAQDWAPSEDGDELVAVGSANALNVNSNGMILLKSFVDGGFDEDKMDDKISVLEGTQCHMARIPAPVRSGITPKTREDGKEFIATILVVESITVLPWEKKGAGATTKNKGGAAQAKAKSKTASKKAAPEADDTELISRVEDILVEALSEADDNTLQKKDVVRILFKAVAKDDENRSELSKIANSVDFLGGEDRPWTFDNGTITL